MKQTNNGPRVSIRLELDGEMAAKFEALKDEWGLHNNTEIIRRMVKEMHDFYIEKQLPNNRNLNNNKLV